MKRYIDEKTGKIVNILNVDEANKVLKILVDYFFTDSNMPNGRLNLVGLLRDFMKLAKIEDILKLIDYMDEYKKTLKLSKDEEENFNSLYRFLSVYKDFYDSKMNIEDATNYISDMAIKKDDIAKKAEKDLSKQDQILKVFFDNGFALNRLAKISCDTWENKIHNQLSNDKKEAIISIEQEIAYQDLLEFAGKDDLEFSANDIKETHNDSKKKDSEKIEEVNKTEKLDINIKIPEKKSEVKVDVETKKEENTEKKEDKIPTIQINNIKANDEDISVKVKNIEIPDDANNQRGEIVEKKEEKVPTIQINNIKGLEDDVPPKPKKENSGENDQKSRRDQGFMSNIQIFVPGEDDEESGKEDKKVNPLEIKNATENVDFKDSVEFFNNVLDEKMSKHSTDDSDGFRD